MTTHEAELKALMLASLDGDAASHRAPATHVLDYAPTQRTDSGSVAHGNSILSEVDETSISGRRSQTRQHCPLSGFQPPGSCPRAAGWSAATLCPGTGRQLLRSSADGLDQTLLG